MENFIFCAVILQFTDYVSHNSWFICSLFQAQLFDPDLIHFFKPNFNWFPFPSENVSLIFLFTMKRTVSNIFLI